MPTVQSLDSLVFPKHPEERSTLRMQLPPVPQADERPTQVADASSPHITQLPSARTRAVSTTWEPAHGGGVDELPVSFTSPRPDSTWPAPRAPRKVEVRRAAQEPTMVLPQDDPPTEIRAPLPELPTARLAPPRPPRRRSADPAQIAVTSSLAGLAVVLLVTVVVGGLLIAWQVLR